MPQYHRWTPGKPVNWRFIDLQQRYRANPDDLSALVRDPSLSDSGGKRASTQGWAKSCGRVCDFIRCITASVTRRASRIFPPPGIRFLARVAGRHAGLAAERYGTLVALNAEWTAFPDMGRGGA